MSGIFNASIFNNAIFNTGTVTPDVLQIPAGVGRRRKKYTARLVEIEKREDLAVFLKKRLNLPLIEEEKPQKASAKIVVRQSILKTQEVDDNDMRKRLLIMLGNII